nr:hypothetical protein [Klebsiella oxytoca]
MSVAGKDDWGKQNTIRGKAIYDRHHWAGMSLHNAWINTSEVRDIRLK